MRPWRRCGWAGLFSDLVLLRLSIAYECLGHPYLGYSILILDGIPLPHSRVEHYLVSFWTHSPAQWGGGSCGQEGLCSVSSGIPVASSPISRNFSLDRYSVTSWLDYHNTLYIDLPLKTTRKLQLVQTKVGNDMHGLVCLCNTSVLWAAFVASLLSGAITVLVVVIHKGLNEIALGYLRKYMCPILSACPIHFGRFGALLQLNNDIYEDPGSVPSMSLCLHTGRRFPLRPK